MAKLFFINKTSIQCISQLYLKQHSSTIWSPNSLGPKWLERLQYIGQTINNHVHIDMKLNFMHILATLGFDRVFPMYWFIESKHAIIFNSYELCMQGISRTKRRYNLEQTSRRNEIAHKSVIKQMFVQIISKKQINTWLPSSFNK